MKPLSPWRTSWQWTWEAPSRGRRKATPARPTHFAVQDEDVVTTIGVVNSRKVIGNNEDDDDDVE